MKSHPNHNANRRGHVGAITVALLGCALAAPAATTWYWTGATDTQWSSAGNWKTPPGQPPAGGSATSGDRIDVTNGVNHALVYTASEGTTTLNRFIVGTTGIAGALAISGGAIVSGAGGDIVANNGGAGTLTLNGGNYTNTNTLTLNNNANANATLTVTSGTATIATLNLKSGSTSSSTVHLDGGTLALSSVIIGGSGTNTIFNFNGGILKTTSALSAFPANTVNVRNGGAIFDTNGKTPTLPAGLRHSAIAGDDATDGGLTKNGAGTLTLAGTNTYTGATSVNAGTLTLASNGVLSFHLGNNGASQPVQGTGAANFNGRFRIAADAASVGFGPWTLVRVDTLTETFHASTFGIELADGTAFTNEGSGLYASGEWEFSTLTGVLTRTPSGTVILLR